MTPPQTKTYSLNNSLGTALLLFGALLCYLHMASIAQQIANTVAGYSTEPVGLVPAAGLTAARVLQDLTLNPLSALSALLQFLLSFWPVGIIFLGALLLRKSIFPVRGVVPAVPQHSERILQADPQ